MQFTLRTTSLICFSAGLLFASDPTGTANEPATEITLGKLFKEELRGPKTYTANVDDYRNSQLAYALGLTIELESGSSVLIDIKPTGKGRNVGFLLEDPAGDRVHVVRPTVPAVKTKIEELSAGGIYRLTVFSDRIGPFELKVSDTSRKVKAIEQKSDEIAQILKDIEQLENSLAEKKEQLRKARALDY